MITLNRKTITGLRWWSIFLLSFVIIYLSVTQLSKASLYGIFNIFTVDLNEDSTETFGADRKNLLLLKNFSQGESDLSSSRLKLYFVQTSENDDVLSRHACSIESAARLHPHGLIFVLMRSKYVHLKKGAYGRLKAYENLRFLHFDEQDVYSGTTLSRLNEMKRRQYIRYFAVSHMSDFIRTALLYKYGGIYFDLDVIPLRQFSTFQNAVGLESSDGVNVAVLAFEKQHLALDIQMDLQLASIQTRLQAFCWNCVGPLALSDALKRVCDDGQLLVHAKDKCQQIDIQPSFVFYPIAYQEIPQFFRRSTSSESIDALSRNSSIYSIHYFHHMTMNLPIEPMSPFARLAKFSCPMVYEQMIDPSDPVAKHTSTTAFLRRNAKIILLCLCISILGILVCLVAGTVLSSLTPFRATLVTMQKKFYAPL